MVPRAAHRHEDPEAVLLQRPVVVDADRKGRARPEPATRRPCRSASRRTGVAMITKQAVREILAECFEMGLPEQFDDDTPLVIDSYAGAWIQYLLEERLGVI